MYEQPGIGFYIGAIHREFLGGSRGQRSGGGDHSPSLVGQVITSQEVAQLPSERARFRAARDVLTPGTTTENNTPTLF